MRILIPRIVPRLFPRQQTSPLFGVYYTLRQVSGRSVAVADLTYALAKFRRSDVIRWLCAISGWIDADGGMELETQTTMAGFLLAEDLRRGLDAHRRREPGVRGCLFHRRQLWFLLQMAVMACREDTPECPEDTLRHALGECCLMASDILHQIEPNQPPGRGAEEVNKWLAAVVIPILDSKDRVEILARAQAFWLDLPTRDALRRKFSEMHVPDFDTAFTAKYGIPLREWFLILLSLYSGFVGQPSRDPSPILLDEATYLRPSFSEDDLHRVFSAVSQTPDELALKLLGEARQNWTMDVRPLRTRPVIQIFPGKYACPDQGLLYRCLVDGIYFLLDKAYPDKKFAQLFGYVFEEYVHGLIREFSCESDFLVRTFYPCPKFRGTNDEAGDGLILRDDTALLLEYKARLLTTRQKYSGDPEATLQGIDDILYRDKKGSSKGVAQLAKNLARILRGERVAAGANGLGLSAYQHIFPAIIAYEEAVALEAVRQEADAKLRASLQKEGADPSRVGPLLVLCVDDVEVLESLARKHEVRQVIQGYVEHIRRNPKDRAGSFRSYICNCGYAKDPSCGESLVERLFHKAMRESGEEIERRQPVTAGRDPGLNAYVGLPGPSGHPGGAGRQGADNR
jgi:hypothetical protein